MQDAPVLCQGSSEKAFKDWPAFRDTGSPVYEPKGSKYQEQGLFNHGKVRPFRSATGAHMECGHPF